MDTESKTNELNTTSKDDQSGAVDLQDRIPSKLDELHADFKQLGADLREGKREGLQARKDRIDGFKRAFRDIFQAADRADREWH